MADTLFQIGFFQLKTFNLLLFIGVVFSAWILTKVVSLLRLELSHFFEWAHWGFLSALFFGKAFFLLERWFLLRDVFWELLLSSQFSRFGLFFGLSFALVLFSYLKRFSLFNWLDALSPSLLCFLFFVHWGHFFNGTYYGKLTDLPWGIAFDSIAIPFVNPIHPTQLYSALATFLIFNYAVRALRRTHLPGVVAGFSIALYSLISFLIEFVRVSDSWYARAQYSLWFMIGFALYLYASHQKHLSTK